MKTVIEQLQYYIDNLEHSWLYVLEYKDKYVCVIADEHLDQDIEAVADAHELEYPISMDSYELSFYWLDKIKEKYNTKPLEILI